jgi:hypothetical protein
VAQGPGAGSADSVIVFSLSLSLQDLMNVKLLSPRSVAQSIPTQSTGL